MNMHKFPAPFSTLSGCYCTPLIMSEAENDRNYVQTALSMRLLITVYLLGIVNAQPVCTFEWNSSSSLISLLISMLLTCDMCCVWLVAGKSSWLLIGRNQFIVLFETHLHIWRLAWGSSKTFGEKYGHFDSYFRHSGIIICLLNGIISFEEQLLGIQ